MGHEWLSYASENQGVANLMLVIGWHHHGHFCELVVVDHGPPDSRKTGVEIGKIGQES
jgi:hypothetical protein